MKSFFIIERATNTVREIESTPESQALYHKRYATRKEVVRALWLQLCAKADEVIALREKTKAELIELVTAESRKER